MGDRTTRIRERFERPAILLPAAMAGLGWLVAYDVGRLRSSPIFGSGVFWAGVALGFIGLMVGLGLVFWANGGLRSRLTWVFAYALLWMVAFGFSHPRRGGPVVVDQLWIVVAVSGTVATAVFGIAVSGYASITGVSGWWRRRSRGSSRTVGAPPQVE